MKKIILMVIVSIFTSLNVYSQYDEEYKGEYLRPNSWNDRTRIDGGEHIKVIRIVDTNGRTVQKFTKKKHGFLSAKAVLERNEVIVVLNSDYFPPQGRVFKYGDSYGNYYVGRDIWNTTYYSDEEKEKTGIKSKFVCQKSYYNEKYGTVVYQETRININSKGALIDEVVVCNSSRGFKPKLIKRGVFRYPPQQ